MTDDQLSAIVRRVVRKGNFSHLSIACTDGKVFKASFRGVDNKDYHFAESEDPVDALIAALTGRAPKPIKAPRTAKVSRRVRKVEPKDEFADLLE